MDRRRAFAVAAAAALIVAGGAFAAGANLGLFGIASSSAAPALPVTDTAPPPPAAAPSSGDEVRYVDVPITVAVPSGGAAVLPAETDDANDGSAAGPNPPGPAAGSLDQPGSTTTVPRDSDDDDHEDHERSTTSTTEHEEHEFDDD